MIRNSLLFSVFLALLCPLGAQENLEVQRLRQAVEEMLFRVHSHQAEIDLFQERLQHLETISEQTKRDKKEGGNIQEKRLGQIEKAQQSLATDCKTLKNHLQETQTALQACQTRLDKLETQVTTDMDALKKSLSKMLTLLQQAPPVEQENHYVVKAGDSLGQIAHDHKTDTKTLKQLNHLTSDKIYPGQKLRLP